MKQIELSELKGILPRPSRPVTLREMQAAIRTRAVNKASPDRVPSEPDEKATVNAERGRG